DSVEPPPQSRRGVGHEPGVGVEIDGVEAQRRHIGVVADPQVRRDPLDLLHLAPGDDQPAPLGREAVRHGAGDGGGDAEDNHALAGHRARPAPMALERALAAAPFARGPAPGPPPSTIPSRRASDDETRPRGSSRRTTAQNSPNLGYIASN